MVHKGPHIRDDEIVFDDDNPEWTEVDFARARPASEIFPPEIVALLVKKGGRPNQDKQQVTLRIERSVLDHFKAAGPGWQTRINDALKRAIG